MIVTGSRCGPALPLQTARRRDASQTDERGHMINDDPYQDDPVTLLRTVRRGACLTGVTLTAAALAALASGRADDSIRAWNAGLTLLVGSSIAYAFAAGAVLAEPMLRHQRALEIGEQAIVETIRRLSDADELARRRHA